MRPTYYGQKDWVWKRSVKDSSDWQGWPWFIEKYNKIPKSKYPEDSYAAFLTVFQGGFRAAEAVQVRKDMVAYDENAIVIYRCPVLKKTNQMYRNVVIVRDYKNPMADPFIKVVENCEGEYLIPKRTRMLRELIPDEPSTTRTLYNRINEIEGGFTHELRAYRAMMLVAERGFTVSQLMAWFEWEKAEMAIHYTRTRDVGKMMGLDKLPTLSEMKEVE